MKYTVFFKLVLSTGIRYYKTAQLSDTLADAIFYSIINFNDNCVYSFRLCTDMIITDANGKEVYKHNFENERQTA